MNEDCFSSSIEDSDGYNQEEDCIRGLDRFSGGNLKFESAIKAFDYNDDDADSQINYIMQQREKETKK